MKVAVILAGSGVYDGSEIHEAVFTLLALEEQGLESLCFAPNTDQYHVVNHLTGEEASETRNVLVESARIARGAVQDLTRLNPTNVDALVIPGGFGAAKNLNRWAISGPEGPILPELQKVIQEMVRLKKPILGMCMGPTVIAKALEGSGIHPTLTVGSNVEASPYDIAGISQGMESLGAKVEMKTIRQIAIDSENRIITAPCYMMEATISQVMANVRQAVGELKRILES